MKLSIGILGIVLAVGLGTPASALTLGYNFTATLDSQDVTLPDFPVLPPSSSISGSLFFTPGTDTRPEQPYFGMYDTSAVASFEFDGKTAVFDGAGLTQVSDGVPTFPVATDTWHLRFLGTSFLYGTSTVPLSWVITFAFAGLQNVDVNSSDGADQMLQNFALRPVTLEVKGPGNLTTTYSASIGAISPIAAVPVPAGMALFAPALGLLGFMGWHKARKPAAVLA